MDWLSLIEYLSDVPAAEIAAQEPALQFVLGTTTFVLEHDEEGGHVLATGVLAAVPREDELDATAALWHFLKRNMQLLSMGLGSIAWDALEGEFVWRHAWPLASTHEQEVLEALQQADALRAALQAEGWIPTAPAFSEELEGMLAT